MGVLRVARRAKQVLRGLAKAGQLHQGRGVDAGAVLGQGVSVGEGSAVDRNCRIGAHTYIGCYCTLTRVTVGRYCSIANGVSIGPGEHPLDRVSTSAVFYTDAYELLTRAPCAIGNDVWIGSETIIRRGVTVGDGAVIGANSFVTRDVPPYAVVAGTPARLMRLRFSEADVTLLLQSRWWDLEPDEARAALSELQQRVTFPAK